MPAVRAAPCAAISAPGKRRTFGMDTDPINRAGHAADVDAKAVDRNDVLGMFTLLLLLLLRLLAGIRHTPLRQRNRLPQHIKVADMAGDVEGTVR